MNPSYLFDTPENIAAGGGSAHIGTAFLASIIQRDDPGDAPNPQFNSPNDLVTMMKGWAGYDTWNTGYASQVSSKSNNWLPEIGQPIFGGQ